MGFFSQKLSFLRRNWNKWFFFKTFPKIGKKFSIFLKKLEKKFESYISVKKSVKN